MTTPATSYALLLQAAPGGSSPMAGIAFQVIAFIAIIYFFMWRPQQKQRRQHEDALKGLKRGDEVVTAGGIVGEVIHIRETSKDGGTNRLDDRVTIKSGESKLIVERGRIARVVGTATQTTSSTAT